MPLNISVENLSEDEARGELLRELVGEGIAGGSSNRHICLRRCGSLCQARAARRGQRQYSWSISGPTGPAPGGGCRMCNRTRGGAVMRSVWWRCGGYLRESLQKGCQPIKFVRVHVVTRRFASVAIAICRRSDPRPRILIGARSARALHHHASSG